MADVELKREGGIAYREAVPAGRRSAIRCCWFTGSPRAPTCGSRWCGRRRTWVGARWPRTCRVTAIRRPTLGNVGAPRRGNRTVPPRSRPRTRRARAPRLRRADRPELGIRPPSPGICAHPQRPRVVLRHRVARARASVAVRGSWTLRCVAWTSAADDVPGRERPERVSLCIAVFRSNRQGGLARLSVPRSESRIGPATAATAAERPREATKRGLPRDASRFRQPISAIQFSPSKGRPPPWPKRDLP